jgi:hypothetical protein
MNRIAKPGWARWWLLGLGLLLPGLMPAGRAEVTVNVMMTDGALSSVRLIALPNVLFPGGFLPVRVRIENRAAEARTWQITFTSGQAMIGRSGLRSTFSFNAPPSTTHETVVYVPVGQSGQLAGGGMAGLLGGLIDGPDVANENFSFPLGGTARYMAATRVGSAVGAGARFASTPSVDPALRKLAVAEREDLTREQTAHAATLATARPRARPFAGGVNPVLESIASVDPAAWPADWRTWSQFSAVLMSTTAWETMDPARQRALREWIALGGRLILFPEQHGERTESAHGFGVILTLARPVAAMDPINLTRNILGRIGQPGPAAWPAPELVPKTDPMLDIRIGGRWLVGFLIGFAVLIGPVNLFYFAPVGRRHRLFFTVPLISFLGTLVLATVVVASDGWGGRGYRQALVILLPGENEAAVIQRQVARTGMIFGQSFALPADTDLAHRIEGGSGTQNIELERNGDRAAGDWFASRSVQYHDLRRVTPTRARVDLVEAGRDGRGPVLQSSVSTTLRSVRYLDEEGFYWKTDELPPGQRITLQSTGEQAAYGPMTIKLAPGCFYAEGGPGDLAPLPTLASIRWTDKLIHYTGRVEAATK